MFSWRARRQLIGLLIAAIPLILLGFWLFPKILPEPACFDNRKNQGEVEIDCGGPCAPCELRNPKTVTLFWSKAVPVGPSIYDVAAEVENQNEVLSAKKLEYEFTLFDAIGPVAIRRGRTFLFAQERLHLIEVGLGTTREPTRVEVKILKADWELRQDPKPNILVERRDYLVEEADNRRKSVVEAVISNRATLGFKEVEARVVLLDRNENLVGANRVIIENFLAGERRAVRFFWPEELPGEAATIIVEPRVNVFDPSIILRPQ